MTTIRPLTGQDCAAVARLHQEYLPTNFCGWSGSKLLATYYRAMVDQDGAVGYVAIGAAAQVVGFVCGVWDGQLLRRGLFRRHLLPLLFFGLMQLVKNPHLFLSLKNRWRGSVGDTSDHADGYELRPIVVTETARGSGAATDLTQRLKQDAQTRGFKEIHL